MKNLRATVLTFILMLASVPARTASPRWEGVGAAPRSAMVTPQGENRATAPADGGSAEAFDVAVRDGYIYVSCDRPTQVKVFTILGQLISQETLSAGSHRLRMSSRGIYILKTADTTRRVTI